GLDAGCALRPRDPQSSGRVEHADQPRQPPLELAPLREEGDDHVDRRMQLADEHADPVRQLTQRPYEVRRRVEQPEPRVGLDAELRRQRGAGVAGHRPDGTVRAMRSLLLGALGLALAALVVLAVHPLRAAVGYAFHGDVHGLRTQLRGLGAAGAAVLFGLILLHAVVFFPAEI